MTNADVIAGISGRSRAAARAGRIAMAGSIAGAGRVVVAGLSACLFFSIAALPPANAQIVGEPAPGAGEATEPVSGEPAAPIEGEDATLETGPAAPDPSLIESPGDERSPTDASSGLFDTPAPSQPLDPFAAMLTQRGPSAVRLWSRAPQVYETTEGDETFVFQTDGQTGYIRFLCDNGEDTLECDLLAGRQAEEVMMLDASRSPRGDVTSSDRTGEPVLRVTSNGGATLFEPMGALAMQESMVPLGGRAVLPVSRAARSLALPRLSFAVAASRMQRASDLLGERHGTLITFMAPRVPRQGDQAVLADAVLTTAKAIDQVARDPLGKRVIAERLAVVEFRPADQRSLSLADGTLTVAYVPRDGLSGRPSSITVSRYLESNL